MTLLRLLSIFVAFCFLPSVQSYIPAVPTNSTKDTIAGGLNVTDISQLYMQRYSNGPYVMNVSYQLAGSNNSGISKGALVHFSEEKVSTFTPPTSTPWIALIACDKNVTNASTDDDIFTLAQDKGAMSALLYSLYSEACVINPSYSDAASFGQVFDIFSTQSHTSSYVIDYQFGQLTPNNQTILTYDSKRLNDSYGDIERSIKTGVPVSARYIYAVLRPFNATDNTTEFSRNIDAAATQVPASPSKDPNTGLALIILYAITGCVAGLFCIVIISGAIKAIRHPERYGPRAQHGDDGGPPQSRARGLTRAILDTFPIVKFGNTQARPGFHPSGDSREKVGARDPEANIEMGDLSLVNGRTVSAEGDTQLASGSPCSGRLPPNPPSPNTMTKDGETHTLLRDGESQLVAADIAVQGSSRLDADMVPASIGRETCPICIVDFEEGDDIRVLPCEGKHCFHQECVDPWLLKLSSSCPICRHDFLALENMLSGRPDDLDELGPVDHDLQSSEIQEYTSSRGRLSRYLQFARRRRRGDDPDPTDPYMPTAPETSIYAGM